MLRTSLLLSPSDTPSGSTVRRIPGPEWANLLLRVCRASTAVWCYWTWRKWEPRFSTTSCWSPITWPRWPTSTVSGVTWATRTSSPWSAWSIRNSFILWPAAGTDSCAPGGGSTATGMCSSCTIAAKDQFSFITVTVTPRYQRAEDDQRFYPGVDAGFCLLTLMFEQLNTIKSWINKQYNVFHLQYFFITVFFLHVERQ